jgi:hypothetical protein
MTSAHARTTNPDATTTPITIGIEDLRGGGGRIGGGII